MHQIDILKIDPKIRKFLSFHYKILSQLFLGIPFEEIKFDYKDEFKNFNYIFITKAFSLLDYDKEENLRSAYPISPQKSEFEIYIEGMGSGYAMCAIDAIGISYLFEKPITITAKDAVNKENLKVKIDPFNDKYESVDDLVITTPKNKGLLFGESAEQAIVLCPFIGFVKSKESLGQQELEFVDVMKMKTAVNSAKAIFSRHNIEKNFIDFFKIFLYIYQKGYLSTNDEKLIVNTFIENNKVLLNSFSRNDIKMLIINHFLKKNLIIEGNNLYKISELAKDQFNYFIE